MQRMFTALNSNYTEAIEKNTGQFSRILLELNTIENFKEILENEKIKNVLNEVFHDLISSVYMASNGMYRNAYICLRSAIELALSLLYFMDHNYDFLLWQKNNYDVKWSVLNNNEVGVLSNKYLNLFVDGIDFSEFIKKVELVYHSCSEYVHGKYEFMQTNFMNMPIKYDEENFKKWGDCWIEEVKMINVLFSIRLNNNIKNLKSETIRQLKEDAIDMDLRGLINE